MSVYTIAQVYIYAKHYALCSDSTYKRRRQNYQIISIAMHDSSPHGIAGTPASAATPPASAQQPCIASHTNALMMHYEELVQSQSLKPDAQQRACIAQLNILCNQLMAYSHKVDNFEEESEQYQASCMQHCPV